MSFQRSLRVVSIFLAAIVLPACALHSQKTLARSELSAISSVEILKPITPPIEVKTLSGGILMSLGGWVTAPLGAARDESATKEMHSQAQFPDFGELLVRNFAQRAPRELPGWPKTKVITNAGPKYRATERGAVLSFELVNPWLGVLRGFGVEVTGTLKDANGRTLWSKYFWYRSWDFNRSGKQEDYLKNNYALLKQEVELAARDTATVMLGDIRQGL